MPRNSVYDTSVDLEMKKFAKVWKKRLHSDDYNATNDSLYNSCVIICFMIVVLSKSISIVGIGSIYEDF